MNSADEKCIRNSVDLVQLKPRAPGSDEGSKAEHPRAADSLSARVAYWGMLIPLALGLIGVPFVRYAVYLTPLVVLSVWGIAGGGRLYISRHNLPFVGLVALSLLYLPTAGPHALKWTFFLAVYASCFIFFDFSRANFDVRKMNLFFAMTFLVSLTTGGAKPFVTPDLRAALLESTFGVESTFSFIFGLFAAYFLAKRQYFWFLFNTLAALLTFKRIVLVAIVCTVIVGLLPKRWQGILVRGPTVVLVVLLGMFFSVEFAGGRFDEFLLDSLGMSANQLSMGRRNLWETAVQEVNFSYPGYMFSGDGLDRLLGLISEGRLQHWILLHNDLLLVYLAFGALAVVLFSYAIVNQRSSEERLLALFLLALLMTDNVLIYQHVMIPYLLLMAALRREASVR